MNEDEARSRIVPCQMPDGSMNEAIVTLNADGTVSWTVLPWPADDDPDPPRRVV